MDSTLIVICSIFAMLGLMAFGLPVAVSMILVSASGMMLSVGGNYTLTTFTTLPYSVAGNYTFAAIPMFVFMGMLAGATGIIKDIYQAANMWLARVRGGLYMATTIAAACRISTDSRLQSSRNIHCTSWTGTSQGPLRYTESTIPRW